MHLLVGRHLSANVGQKKERAKARPLAANSPASLFYAWRINQPTSLPCIPIYRECQAQVSFAVHSKCRKADFTVPVPDEDKLDPTGITHYHMLSLNYP